MGKKLGRPRGWIHPNTPMPTKRSTTPDLYWAAGFLDGEGSFGLTGGSTASRGERVTASQGSRELLDRLSALFGGRVFSQVFANKSFIGTKYESLTTKPIWRWEVTGQLARGVMMTLYTLMSQHRRSQIKDALTGVAHPRPRSSKVSPNVAQVANN